MNRAWLTIPLAWAAMPAVLAAHVAAGFAIGVLYFGSVWWSARSFARAGRVRIVIVSAIGRLLLLGGLLTLMSLEGALPLLMAALGILAGRTIVMRRTRMVAP